MVYITKTPVHEKRNSLLFLCLAGNNLAAQSDSTPKNAFQSHPGL